MDFKMATDVLFDRVGHAELADALGVSVASIRQARLSETAKARREPPPHWRGAAVRLAELQVLKYQRLADRLRVEAVQEPSR